jgi:hypothetical protein
MKEQIYDERIAPLMKQIIATCKEYKIAFLADFSLDDDLHCTSADLRDDHEPAENQLKAFELLKPKAPPFAITIETLPDGHQKIAMRRIR